MKLWYSFTKELKLASSGFYFYVEIIMALVLLVVVLFAIPENFDNRETEYIYLDLPPSAAESWMKELAGEDLDGSPETVEIKAKGETFPARYYETSEARIYIVESEDALVKIADAKEKPAVAIKAGADGSPSYTYYLQGYESQKLKNLYLAVNNSELASLQEGIESQDVRPISTDYEFLSDRENTIPAVLTFNGSFMGMFLIAAYIFLDKDAGIISAYAITASSVWQYLMSKVLVILVTTIITSLVITVPVMGLKPDYPLMLLFLVTTGFFASSLGLVVSGYFRNMTQAFSTIFIIMLALMLPTIAYFIPSWEPAWIRFLPSYPMLQGFREIIMKNGDTTYVLLGSLLFLAAGTVLFIWSSVKHKKTLTA